MKISLFFMQIAAAGVPHFLWGSELATNALYLGLCRGISIVSG